MGKKENFNIKKNMDQEQLIRINETLAVRIGKTLRNTEVSLDKDVFGKDATIDIFIEDMRRMVSDLLDMCEAEIEADVLGEAFKCGYMLERSQRLSKAKKK